MTLFSSSEIGLAGETFALRRIFQRLDEVRPVVARQADRLRLGFLLLAAFTVAVFECRSPGFRGSETASARATPKSVNLLFVRASQRLPARIHSAGKFCLFEFDDADCVLARNSTRFRVTFRFIAFSAAAAILGAFFS